MREKATELEASNLRERILLHISLTGELISRNPGSRFPYSEDYVQRTIKKLREDNLIRYFRYDDGRRFYRLSDTLGTEVLSVLSPTALEHFDMMVGPSGKRYKGDSDFRLKQRRVFELCDLYLSKGIEIDGMKIIATDKVDKTHPLEACKDFKESLQEQGPSRVSFYTNKYIRGSSAIADFGTIPKYKSAGVLATEQNIYTVYHLGGAGEMWFKENEQQRNGQIERIARNCEVKRATDQAIVYFPNKRIATEFTIGKTKNIKIKPEDVYRACYIIPMSENPMDATEMLIQKNWKNELDKLLIQKKAEARALEDGYAADGSDMYNLLCTNICKLKRIATRVTTRKSTLIVHEWMAPAAEALYGKNVTLVPISDEQFEVLLMAVKREILP